MKQMRRADHLRDETWALEVFDTAPFVTVSMTRRDGTPKYMEHFDDAIARSLYRTTVVRITLIAPPVGKSKP